MSILVSYFTWESRAEPRRPVLSRFYKIMEFSVMRTQVGITGPDGEKRTIHLCF